MTEVLRRPGRWSLPSNPDRTIPGVLTFEPLEGWRLELDGSLASEQVDEGEPWKLEPPNEPYAVINGDTGSGAVTLLRGYSTRLGGRWPHRPLEVVEGHGYCSNA